MTLITGRAAPQTSPAPRLQMPAVRQIEQGMIDTPVAALGQALLTVCANSACGLVALNPALRATTAPGVMKATVTCAPT